MAFVSTARLVKSAEQSDAALFAEASGNGASAATTYECVGGGGRGAVISMAVERVVQSADQSHAALAIATDTDTNTVAAATTCVCHSVVCLHLCQCAWSQRCSVLTVATSGAVG